MPARLCFTLLLVATLPAAITACSVTGITVVKAASPAKPSESGAYTLADVQSHFSQMDEGALAKNVNSMFTCVDARGDSMTLSTPGGDYAELSDAIYVFAEQTGIKLNATSIAHIFRAFMAKVASPERRFYFHTDEGKLASLFTAVYNAGVKPKPVVFPAVMPHDEKIARIWLQYLSKPEYQGCGHVRLMLYKPKEYGLSSSYVPEELIKQFFAYWWPTPIGSPERQKVKFAVKRGPLQGKAVAIVNNAGPACPDETPMSLPAHHGSSIFVYHQKAVGDLRAKVLAPFFADMAKQTFFTGTPLAFDQARFTKRLDSLAGSQLGYTINNLYPADSVSLYSVNYALKDDGKTNNE